MKRRCSTLSQFQYPDGVSIPRSTSEAQRSERYWQLCVDLRGRPLGAQRDTPCGISLPKPLRAKWHLTPLKLRLSSFEKFRKEGGGGGEGERGKGENGDIFNTTSFSAPRVNLADAQCCHLGASGYFGVFLLRFGRPLPPETAINGPGNVDFRKERGMTSSMMLIHVDFNCLMAVLVLKDGTMASG